MNHDHKLDIFFVLCYFIIIVSVFPIKYRVHPHNPNINPDPKVGMPMKSALYFTLVFMHFALAFGHTAAFKIALAGDSTVQDYPLPHERRGWGQMLPMHINKNVTIENFARGGKSTKTFLKQGHWKKLLKSKPNLILLQFGHNDSHKKGRPESTDANGDFIEYLKTYIHEARSHDIEIILITPPHRRFLRHGKPGSSLIPYAKSMKLVGEKLKVPVIDLQNYWTEQLIALGEDGAIPMYCNPKDRSHFSLKGANLLASYIAEKLYQYRPSLKKELQ